MRNFLLPAALGCLIATFANAQCDPVHGKVVINEVCPFNTSIAQNSIGEYHDYVELFNNTAQAINLNGYFLSDRRGDRTKYQFPNVSIPANGFLVVWCDGIGDPNQSGLNAAFSLSSTDGEQVVLSNPDTLILDYVRYGPTAENISVGRFPNGSGPFTTMIPSFNAFNFNGDALNVVINEFMARNSSTITDIFGEFDDWIELYNNSLGLVNLNGYFLSDDSGVREKFKFQNTFIGPNQYVVVWADIQPEQGNLHAAFGLGGDGEEVILSNPDTLTIDYMRFGPQEQDVSQGRLPNGIGKSTACLAPTYNGPNSGIVNTDDKEKTISEIVLFPNPARESISVNNPNPVPELLYLTDMKGSVVKQLLLYPGNNELIISDLPSGAYGLQTPFGKAKLIKQ